MDTFLEPADDFLHETFQQYVSAGIGVEVSDSAMEVTTTFNIMQYIRWQQLLGMPLSRAYSAMHQIVLLVVSLCREFFHNGFLKAFQFSISDEFINQLASSRFEDNITGSTGIWFVGNKSYIWGSDILCGNKPICHHRNVVVSVDMETRKPAPLDPSWKQRALQHIENKGLKNEQIPLPSLQNTGSTILEFNLIIQKGHLDFNNHANYKTYVFGGFAVIRQAIESHLLAEFENFSYSDVIIHDVIIVFEQESRLGDTVLFSLYKKTDGEFTVTCYKNSVRLSYGNYKVAKIARAKPHL